MSILETLEASVQQLGARLLVSERQKRFTLFDRSFWDEKLLDWAMGDDELRVQLFRFIDCLPALQTNRQVADHLREYLGGLDLPGPLKKTLEVDPASAAAAAAALGVRQGIGQMARRFICGDTLKAAVRSLEKLRAAGFAFSIDLLGEAVVSEVEADLYQQRYLDLLQGVHDAVASWPMRDGIDRVEGRSLPRVHCALKLTSFYSQFDAIDPERTSRIVRHRLRPILLKARELGAFVHIDMEQSQHKDLILQIFQDLLFEPELRDWTDTGICLQAYLRSAPRDAERLLEWARLRGYPFTIRLVKGAYWDTEVIQAAQRRWPVPVFTRKADTDAQYESLLCLLLENHRSINTAIASHNARSVAFAIAQARQLRVPRERYEFQMLYGMADSLKGTVAEQGERVRVYAPYGELLPGMAYLIRRLLENTANTSFLRQSTTATADLSRLLAAPVAVGAGREAPVLPLAGFANAPDRDFALASRREEQQAALRQVQTEFGRTWWPIVGHSRCGSARSVIVTDPSDPQTVVGYRTEATVELAERAIQTARAAWPAWRRTSVQERRRLLFRVAERLEAERAILSAWLMHEVGKPWRDADAEVSEAIDFCHYYADQMLRLETATQPHDVPGETNRCTYRGRGVAAVIAPWNFPLAILAGMTAAALAAGNTVIMKPAEQGSLVAARWMAICEQAGLPAGVVNYLPGLGEEVGEYLVAHPLVPLVAFTGSFAVGSAILRRAGEVRPGQRHLKRVIAEMGGKNAIIVDSDADLDQAVAGVVQSAFGYAGQKCSACSRVIVLADIYQSFAARLVEAARSLRVGPAPDAGTSVGPVIDRATYERVQQVIRQAKREHELLMEVDTRQAGVGYFIGPTIFGHVDSHSPLAQEEIFAPVLALIRAESFDEAIEIANNTPYALTGGLYSRHPGHIAQARERIECGNFYINRKITAALVERQPFGGFRLSGIGAKAGGPDYLLQFLETVSTTENIQRQGFAPLPSEYDDSSIDTSAPM